MGMKGLLWIHEIFNTCRNALSWMRKNLILLSLGITSTLALFLLSMAPSSLNVMIGGTFAQGSVDTSNKTLGQPFYSEDGKITGPYT